MNLTTVEGPYMYNAVIDFTDVNPPLPINPVINEEKTKQYHVPIRINDRQQPFVHRSIVDCDNMIQINKWTKDFIYDIILPKLNEHEHFKYYHTQPLSFIKDNIIIGSTLIKDSVGFSQAIHTDPHHTVLAGVVHLQDAIDCGTTFYAHNPNTGEWTQKLSLIHI